MKNTKDMQTCVAIWKEINQHLQNHVTCNWANQIHEKHTTKLKTKRHAKLCCSFKGDLPCELALLLLFQESFGNLISQEMRFSSLFTKIIPIKNKLEPNSLRWKAMDKNLIWEENIPPKCLWTKNKWMIFNLHKQCRDPKGKRGPLLYNHCYFLVKWENKAPLKVGQRQNKSHCPLPMVRKMFNS